ncbi:MAG: iron ABC transporter substrate-binding protein [Balneolales bacterium]|nr:iron ABC transporter substrate-binding protein [Balneolales bacterium]
MKRFILLVVAISLALFLVYNNRSSSDLVIYSGRSKALVDPIIERFEEQTGIKVEVKYGGTTQLAVALIEEGNRTPADIFWAQDAGALGALAKVDLLAPLSENILSKVPPRYSSDSGLWIATSGRARVMAYSTRRVESSDLPATLFDLTDSKWSNRIAWAPTNGSFQSFISAMITIHGYDTTKLWVEGIRNNGAKNYANNNAILQGIAAGEADLGLTNHYYLFRSKAADPNFPVSNAFFEAGDVGNMVNVAGIAITKPSEKRSAAEEFVRFLLSDETQNWFASEVYEYSVTEVGELPGESESEPVIELSPDIDLESLANLEETLKLLREVGLL